MSGVSQVAGTVPTTTLPNGEPIPVLGQGTWHMAEDPRRRRTEITALRVGLDLGLTLIDTAEMYANGGAEELVGEAIAGRREEVFLVSKVLPEHATRRGTIAACERSLRRLGTDRLDLYLLHWRGEVPLEATLEMRNLVYALAVVPRRSYFYLLADANAAVCSASSSVGSSHGPS